MTQGMFLVAKALFLILFSTCGSPEDSRSARPTAWETGYWVWGYDTEKPAVVEGKPAVDVIYVQARRLRQRFVLPWSDELPRARAYFIVFRMEAAFGGAWMPREPLINDIADDYLRLKRQASSKGLAVAGLQIDFDCPTEKLPKYGALLETLRRRLPDERISVTALLDWFLPGTGVESILQPVDEFVPQFYDVGAARPVDARPGISLAIDPDRWSPLFNRYKRPYRIGISTFGRIYKEGKHEGVVDDISLLTVASSPKLRARRSRTRAGEILLDYRAEADVWVEDYFLHKEESIQVILPTIESVGRNYKAAKRFGDYCAGVVFFRWPLGDETTVLDPDEVQQAIRNRQTSGRDRLVAEDGGCATVHCSDLYLTLRNRYQEVPQTVTISSSNDLDYFRASEYVKAERVDQQGLALTLPAFPGQRRIYLGRAFSTQASDYQLEDE